MTKKVDSKNWYKSKTVWVSVLTIVAGIITGIAGELEAGASLTVLGIVNVSLRVFTKEGVRFR